MDHDTTQPIDVMDINSISDGDMDIVTVKEEYSEVLIS